MSARRVGVRSLPAATAASAVVNASSTRRRAARQAATWWARPFWNVGRLANEPELSGAPLAVSDGLGSALAWPVELDGQVLGVMEFYAPSIPPPARGTLRW